jgi:DNA-binding NarL/FixJ family response regulator
LAQVSVLLVDNNPGFLRILTSFLERFGQNEIVILGTAGGGTEALTRVQALRPQVIIIDLVMPDLNGLETIPQLRRMLPDAGIIALTLMDSTSYRQAALAAGANDFVSKTRLDTDLLPAIWRFRRSDGNLQGSANGPGGAGAIGA